MIYPVNTPNIIATQYNNTLVSTMSTHNVQYTQFYNIILISPIILLIIPGYQEDDINPGDVTTFQLVIGNQVLDENGAEKKEHKYVFAPDG